MEAKARLETTARAAQPSGARPLSCPKLIFGSSVSSTETSFSQKLNTVTYSSNNIIAKP